MMFVDTAKITDAIDSIIDSMRAMNQDLFTGFILSILHELASTPKTSASPVKFYLSQLAQDIDIYYPIRVNSGIDTDDGRYVADGCTNFDWDSMCAAMHDDLYDVVRGLQLLAENDLEITCNVETVTHQINSDLLTLNWLITMYHNELVNKEWYRPYKF